MQITLYNNIKLLNRLERTFGGAVTITGELRDPVNVIDCDIAVEYNAAYLQKNYAYIPAFNRYYYFKSAPSIDGKIMTLHLHADALYNYRDLIMKSECIAERSSSHYDLYLDDDAILATAGYDYFSRSLPFEFDADAGTYILMCAGGS